MSKADGLGLYRLATGLVEPFVASVLRERARRGKEDPARIGERMGRPGRERPQGRLAWLHGASVGETLSLLPLIDALASEAPDLRILVTSGTTTSAELLARRLPTGAIHQYVPVDAPRAVARFVDHWRPDLAVFVESEIWPNLLTGVRARGARTALVSARLSAASARRWSRSPAAARGLLQGFDLVLPQDDDAAARLSALGARDDGRLNLKLAGAPLPVDEAVLAERRAAAGERPVIVAASTHPGEEALVLEVFQNLLGLAPRPLLVVAPRHPVRGREVQDAALAAGLTATRQGAGEAFATADVHVADALGELGTWFALAATVVMGGGLSPGVGGHNPLEPARQGAPVISGDHVVNWQGVYAALRAVDGVAMVSGAASLASAVAGDLADPAAARARAVRAKALADAGAGEAAVARRLLELIG